MSNGLKVVIVVVLFCIAVVLSQVISFAITGGPANGITQYNATSFATGAIMGLPVGFLVIRFFIKDKT
jgi:hypothetical protein